jgi:hypothetical protein
MRKLTNLVTLNLFQGASSRQEQPVRDEKWMLKQVQHDGEF